MNSENAVVAAGRRARPLPAGPPAAGRAVRRERPWASRIYRLMKRLHMYTGLFNFSNLIVFGIAGLTATFSPPPPERTPPEVVETRLVPFTVPVGWTDKEVADRIYRQLDPPLAGPVPEWALRQDEEGRLLVNFYTASGPRRVTVLEEERLLRVDVTRNSVWRFINNLHATTLRGEKGDWRVSLWAWYMELAIWSLLGMALSGFYLWLATRPRLRLAVYGSIGGSAAFVLLYLLTR